MPSKIVYKKVRDEYSIIYVNILIQFYRISSIALIKSEDEKHWECSILNHIDNRKGQAIPFQIQYKELYIRTSILISFGK